MAAGGAPHEVWAAHRTPPAWGPGPRQLDVGTAGASYNHAYWDWEQPELSYAAAALAAGRAVLLYDRLGTGGSTRPASADVTVETDAFVLHQVMSWARAAGYEVVNVLGHSLGSLVAIAAASRWPADPSRLILTGVRHRANEAAMGLVAGTMYPAGEDPAFTGAALDPGWYTTRPGTRGMVFHAPEADPAVIAADEKGKDVYAAPHYVAGMAVITDPPEVNVSGRITAPVLLVNGDQDLLFCAGTAACASARDMTEDEAPYFRAAQSFTVRLVPGGHNVNLSPTAPLAYDTINAWIAATPAQ